MGGLPRWLRAKCFSRWTDHGQTWCKIVAGGSLYPFSITSPHARTTRCR